MSASSGSPPDPVRPVVIVVPHADTKLYEYLKRSFAGTRDVQVVLDRRQPPATGPRAPIANDLRRRQPAARRALAGVLIDNAATPPPDPPPPAPASPVATKPERAETPVTPAEGKPGKSRLWPTLRLNDLTLLPESDERPAGGSPSRER